MRKSLIYVWLCPISGKPVYVGKTSQTINLRMRAHKREARKGLTPKAVWLNEALLRQTFPRIVVLCECPCAVSSAVERRWHRRLSSRFDLLNVSIPGAGNPGVGRVIWTEDLLSKLGVVSDADLASEIGCERKTVSYRRECLKIPASFNRRNNTKPPIMGGWNKVILSDEIIASLGKMPDYKLANLAGVSKIKIGDERRQRGIMDFAKATGNDGKIKRGEPHRRWTSAPGNVT